MRYTVVESQGWQIFFFLINNVRILLMIKRLPNRVHWGCTMGAQVRKQKNNGQETKKRKNKKLALL